MTLGEGKAKVYKLLDEYSSGGSVTVDTDIEAKMTDFFDIAQKQIAQIKRIVRLFEIVPEETITLYEMPENFESVYRIWRDGKVATGRYHWKAGTLIIPATDAGVTIEVEYFAVPARIPVDAPDDYKFDVAEDAAECMPFFVAAQQLAPDLVVDYGVFLNMYNLMLSTLDTTLPGAGVGRKLQNTFFRI